MIVTSDLPMLRDLLARQRETIRIPNDGTTIQGITCEDIVSLALAMHDHSYFFSVRRDINVRFCRDMNGGGTQGLFIQIKNDELEPPHLLNVLFTPVYRDDGEFHYEADLFMDQRKDYEPTLNKGKHRFVAKVAALNIDWNSEIIQKWRKDIKRLSFSPDTLSSWIEKDLDMLVFCGLPHFCRIPKILTTSDLKQYSAKGMTLEDLKTRLTCSKCGKRGARLKVF